MIIIPSPTFEELVDEATARAKILGIDKEEDLAVIGSGKAIMLSPPSCLHDYIGTLVLEKRQRDLEDRFGILIWGYIDAADHEDLFRNYLYVSRDVSEWEREREDLWNGDFCMAYADNVEHPIYSEFGLIGICKTDVGWFRTS